MIKEINKEGLIDINGSQLWWTDYLKDISYDIVKDNKYPIMIISHNRPESSILKKVISKFTSEYNYPTYFFVRDSQRDSYQKSIDKFISEKECVHLISYPDSEMIGAGLARKKVQEYCKENNISHIFMLDDDICDMYYLNRGLTGKGDPKSVRIKDINPAVIFAMWQYSMEAIQRKHPNVVISTPVKGHEYWIYENCVKNNSCRLCQFVAITLCMDIKQITDNDICYRDNKEVGHEDFQLLAECFDKNLITAQIPFLSANVKDCAALDSFCDFGWTSAYQRMQEQCQLLQNIWVDHKYVYFIEDKKGKYMRPKINFSRYRKDNNLPLKVDIFDDLY